MQGIESLDSGGSAGKTFKEYVRTARTWTNRIGNFASLLTALTGQAEFVPLITDVVSALNVMYGLVETGTHLYDIFLYQDYTDLQGLLGTLYNVLIGDASKVRPVLNDSTMMTTLTMTNILSQIQNVSSGSSGAGPMDDQTRIEIYYKPLDGLTNTFLGQKMVNWSNKFRNVNTAQWANRLPVHAFIVINVPTYASLDYYSRNQYILSFGDGQLKFGRINGDSTRNQLNCVGISQIFEGDGSVDDDTQIIWDDAGMFYNYNTPDVAALRDMIDASTLIKVCTTFNSDPIVRTFIDLMTKSETPYNLFNHNCQHFASEVMKFFCEAQLPHWWQPDYSRQMLLADMTYWQTHPAGMPNQFRGSSAGNIPGFYFRAGTSDIDSKRVMVKHVRKRQPRDYIGKGFYIPMINFGVETTNLGDALATYQSLYDASIGTWITQLS